MNNEAIGVLGSLRPQRSVIDKRLQSEFNRTHESFTMSRQNEAIGVLGSANPNQRSVMDKRMQREFNRENYTEQRSVKDRMMARMYNPQMYEGYCNRNSNFSGYQNPYNPLTPLIQNARLQ